MIIQRVDITATLHSTLHTFERRLMTQSVDTIVQRCYFRLYLTFVQRSITQSVDKIVWHPCFTLYRDRLRRHTVDPLLLIPRPCFVASYVAALRYATTCYRLGGAHAARTPARTHPPHPASLLPHHPHHPTTPALIRNCRRANRMLLPQVDDAVKGSVLFGMAQHVV